jgi:hypothetical protein
MGPKQYILRVATSKKCSYFAVQTLAIEKY